MSTAASANPALVVDDSVRPTVIPFVLFHLAVLGVFWSGFTTGAVITCIALYVVRVFGITAGYHRLLSHRAYKAGRVTQFLIVLCGAMAMQRGPLWWAAKHREHHRDSDTPADAHSPRHYGFWGAHVGWIFRKRADADMSLIQDFAKYPELRWLQKHEYAPGMLLGIACFLIGGAPGLFVGFVLSTMLVYHATFMINSLAHVFGKQRYLTGDDSRNNWLLAIIAMGEGWHNNHHYYPASARNGFFWYEYDATWYVLKLLERFGLVWDLKTPPKSVLENTKQPSSTIIDKTAGHLVAGFSVDKLAQQIRQSWNNSHHWEEFKARARQALADGEAYLRSIELPSLPSLEEMKRRARRKFANTPSLDLAVVRAREQLAQRVSQRLLEDVRRELPLAA
ncbi:MAG TPA: fatty acid desaturase [Nevskiales bacterium]|nr:fatty acid desaturase [Nevskiales bacterium]